MLPLDLDALSACESDGLHHDLMVHGPEVGLRVRGVVEMGEPEVAGDAVLLDELPHERLGRLDPGGGLGRGCAWDALGLEGVHNAFLQRGLGPDEGQLDPFLLGEGDDLVHILLVAEQMLLRPGDDARVGILHHCVNLGAGAGQRLHGGMLPAPSAHGEDLHVDTFRA